MKHDERQRELDLPITGYIRRTAWVAIGLFVSLFLYISYLQIFESDFLAAHPLNKRTAAWNKSIPPGKIIDKQNHVLAASEPDSSGFKRHYPYGAAMAQVVGYASATYGSAGLEATAADYLSGRKHPLSRLGAIAALLAPKAGADVVLTLDAGLQEAAYRALGSRRGAVVALNPKTGEILALASTPSYNPNTVDADWATLSTDAHSPLLNRALQGLYPPGSTIKPMIAETALAEKITDLQREFTCKGTLQIGTDYTLTEAHDHAHGRLKLPAALAESCNITFGTLALELGRSRMAKTFDRFGFNQAVGGDVQEAASHLPDFAALGDGDLAQTGIGQGSLLVTPLHMAMLASSFANQGVIMKPYLIDHIQAADGGILKRSVPETWLQPTNREMAAIIRDMMIQVVTDGTGGSAALSRIQVAGKTGTAENPHGDSHAWFIGFAPADNPEVAVAVIVENAGAGGDMAAPIARQIFAKALR